MYALLLTVFRLLLITFVLGGVAVTFFQVAGILIASPGLTSFFGGDFADWTCVVAALAGIVSFLQLYTKGAKGAKDAEELV
ncbi:hypothetical protein [Nonomuraea sp. NPDC050540]|uniref:hypothetical protein n=1 Tax=Nonomuraea sp. NPDC050540 TaxID=3364367 RepID=UPI0037B839DF